MQKIRLVSPAERANFKNNRKLFKSAKDDALAFFKTRDREPLHKIFDDMFGTHGTHRRLYDPKTNGWRSAFRASRQVVDIQ